MSSLPLSAMPVCPCVTSLTGGGWFFDVQFCLAAPWWRYGVLLAAPWWPWAVSTTAPGWPWAVLWAASWWLQLVFVQPVLLARRMPQGSMLPRPVAATSGLLDCFAWHPSLVEFHWVSPFSSTWGLMLVATRAPFDCPCSFGCARLQCRSATRPRGRLALVADDHEATEVADPADPVLDPPGLASETSAQSDPAGPEVRADPNAEVRVNPSVAPTATAPAAPEGPAVPATAAPAVRKGQAVPATAAPMVRKGQAVPATAAPMVRKGQTVPATAATALRTDLPVPNIVAPVVRTPQRAADSPPAPLVPLEMDAMVEDVVDEASSGQNLVADGSLPDDAPYDPLVHAETSAMLEEALEISRDCVLLADMDGVLQADGEDLVNEAIPEAADSIIREVAAKILGADAPSDGSDPPIALAKMDPSPSASPPKSGLSKSAPAGLRRAAMPVVPEHQEFDEWCAARSRTPPANVAVHPFEARASSIPPPRPHKRQAPSSDPSRAKRSRASASSSSRIPSSTKAGMSSVNNSPAETARQSRREK
ncbi:hypothetical protein V6N11_018383 [Hibiscus sabdariffa]|uniref:Uncharacterized protein n=1 Tax=Hibiscus sabdariffa TaxID=183260 RepID=A0ABR2T7R7_9ROSI